MRLKDQVALVAGGSRGIGRGIVRAFGREGAKVAFVYRGNQLAADALVSEVTQADGTILALQGDVAVSETAARCIEQVQHAWGGRLDILVNNAGVIRDGLFVRMSEEDWHRVISTNLDGVFRFCRIASELMALKQRAGRIINISSLAAEHVNKGQANYVASKGAINALTKALATELAARNVTVNAIAPGFIETDMTTALRTATGATTKTKMPAT